MKKKDSPLTIIFLFICLTAACLGVFYYFTDYGISFGNKSALSTRIYNEDNSVTYSRIYIKDNSSSDIVLDGKDIKLSYDDSHSYLLFNDSRLILISSRKTYEFFNYNNIYLIVYEFSKRLETGALYIFDKNGDTIDYITNVDNENKIMKPYAITLRGNELIIDAQRIRDDGKLMIVNESFNAPSICDERALNQYSIIQDDVAAARYSLYIDSYNQVSFKMIEVLKTIRDYSESYCNE